MDSSIPTRVAHVTFDMRIGGTEQVILNLIEASDPAITRMSIFCIEEPLGPWGEELRAAGTDIESHPRQPGFDFRLVRRLRQHLKAQRIDVVHCHQYTPWVYGSLAAAGTKTRVLFTEHGRFHPDRASPKRRYINPVLARLTQHITAISQATKQALVEYEYLSANRIEVIYNGIRPLEPAVTAARALREDLGISSDTLVLGSIARFDTIKNHMMMLDAFRLIVDHNPESRLLLVGDGEERESIRSRIEGLKLKDHVILPGYITKPGVWLEAMDIFLLSSFSEGTSMTLLEAMSLAKPCVVTNVGGNPEVITDGYTGRITPSNDSAAFADAACALMANPTLLEDYGSNAQRDFEKRFSAASMSSHFERLYASI